MAREQTSIDAFSSLFPRLPPAREIEVYYISYENINILSAFTEKKKKKKKHQKKKKKKKKKKQQQKKQQLYLIVGALCCSYLNINIFDLRLLEKPIEPSVVHSSINAVDHAK